VLGADDAPELPEGVDLLALVRRYEPVLQFTAGELFFPMPVGSYLAHAALWGTDPTGRERTPIEIVPPGSLSPELLAKTAVAHPEAALYLRYATRSLKGAELRTWRRRPDRPSFKGAGRLAAVGLLGRFIDSGMRLSLLIRGRVPGGLTASAQQLYSETAPPDAYHAHVSTDGGYITIQYWFLYAMNDWRSSFGGVNDHESDWEQVTLFLAPVDPMATPTTMDGYALAWIAFSSHDDTGDELRRRPDDPDIGWVDGTHPIVHAGAGSHSGAYLAGDYLVRAQPPALDRMFWVITSVRSLLFPWTRDEPRLGVGIPYVDYRRGDGVRIGPGTDRPWEPILIDSHTPWVRDYRGLWGLDTADPFGGERAPAGPRYERSGAIRASWGDPVCWAGLDKIPPTPIDAMASEFARIADLDSEIADLSSQIATGQEKLRRAASGVAALPPSVTSRRRGDGSAALVSLREDEIAALRNRRRDAVNERDQLQQVRDVVRVPPPHAHLRHRSVPDTAPSAGALVRFWSGASLSFLLALIGISLLVYGSSALWIALLAVLVVMAVEAVLRRRLIVFLLSVVILAGVVVLLWLLFTHFRIAIGVLALIAAVVIGVANLRNVLARR
jgi:hypothetical protein